jgi:hypothetical protein
MRRALLTVNAVTNPTRKYKRAPWVDVMSQKSDIDTRANPRIY